MFTFCHLLVVDGVGALIDAEVEAQRHAGAKPRCGVGREAQPVLAAARRRKGKARVARKVFVKKLKIKWIRYFQCNALTKKNRKDKFKKKNFFKKKKKFKKITIFLY